MKKLLTVLLTVMMAFTTITFNIVADEEKVSDPKPDFTFTVTVTTPKVDDAGFSISFNPSTTAKTEWQIWDETKGANGEWADYKIGGPGPADPKTIVEGYYRLQKIELDLTAENKNKKVQLTGNVSSDVTQANNEGKVIFEVEREGTKTNKSSGLYFVNVSNKEDAIPATVTAKTGLVYDNTSKALVTVDSSDTELTTGAKMKYAVTENTVTDAPTAWLDDVPTGTNAGTYRVWYYADATDIATTHNSSTPTYVDVTIAKATLTLAVSIDNWTEGETAKEPKVTGNTLNVTVTYAYKVKGAQDTTYKATAPTEAGEYTVKASIKNIDNVNDATATADFKVLEPAKDVEIPVENVDINDLTYTGWNQQANIEGLSAAEERHFWYTEKHYTVTYEQKQKIEPNKAGLAADEKKPEPKDEWVAVDNCKDAGDYKAIITLDEGYKFVKAEPNKAGLAADEKKPPEAPEDPKKKLSEDGKTLTIEFKVNKAPVFVYLQNDSVEAKLDKDGNLVKQEPVVRTWTNTYTKPELNIKVDGKGDSTKIGKYNVNVKLKDDKNFYLVEIDKDGNYAKDKEGNYKKANEVKLAYEITKIYARASLKNAYVYWNGEDQQPTVLINGKALDEKYFEVSEGEYVDVASYKVTVTLKHPGRNIYTFDKEKKDHATKSVELTYNIIKANQPQVQLYNNDVRGYVANLDSDCEMQITNLDAYDAGIKLEVWDYGWKEVEEFEYDEDGNFNVEAGYYRITALGCDHHNDSAPTYFTVRTVANEDGEAYSIADKKIVVKTAEVTMVCDYDYEEYSYTNPWTGEEYFSWDNLKKVTVDGEEIDILSVVSNSTDVTFATKTLAVGTHEVSFHYENGMHVEGKLIVYNNNNYVAPKTGC